jgi:hypothetical protein
MVSVDLPGRKPMRTAIAAGAVYFVIVFAVGFALGVPRTLWLEPALGRWPAVAMELPVILAVSWIACRWCVQRHGVAALPSHRAVMGLVAFALVMLAELVMSMFLMGRSLWQHLLAFADPAAAMGLISQMAFAMFPVVQIWRPRD